MASLLSHVDPDGLLEYSVVFSDRSLNSMSQRFCEVMRDLSTLLKSMYSAHSVAIIPGGGTYGMEAIVRQFTANQHCLVIRNGWFSYRWTQILKMAEVAKSSTVLCAHALSQEHHAAFEPPPLEKVISTIKQEQPKVVFCPHVETSAGMILPDSYLSSIAQAVHEYDGLFVLDCIASGTLLIDMEKVGVDILLSAPQKGWSSTPCAALVMMSERARHLTEDRQSSSFSMDLKRWTHIMEKYEQGGHAYHATMPTDGLHQLRNTLVEAKHIGFEALQEAQWTLGQRLRAALESQGFSSVAAYGFQAPTVIVSHTQDSQIQSGRSFSHLGIQIAAGVPLQCGERADFSSFRVGLFGLDKLVDIDRTIESFTQVLNHLTTTS